MFFISTVGAQTSGPAWCQPSSSQPGDLCPSVGGSAMFSSGHVSVSGPYFGGLSTNYPTCGSLMPPVPEGGSTTGFTWSTDDGLGGNVSYIAAQVGEGGQCTGTNQPEYGTYSFSFTDNTPGAHTITISYLNTAFTNENLTQTFSYGNTVTQADLVSDNIPATFSPSQVSSPITIVVTGLAASMGSILLCAAPKGRRLLYPHARVLIHQPLISGRFIGPATDINIQAQEMEKIRAELNQILANASGQTIDKIARDSDRDFYLNAQEAIAYGLADKIVEKS